MSEPYPNKMTPHERTEELHGLGTKPDFNDEG